MQLSLNDVKLKTSSFLWVFVALALQFNLIQSINLMFTFSINGSVVYM